MPHPGGFIENLVRQRHARLVARSPRC